MPIFSSKIYEKTTIFGGFFGAVSGTWTRDLVLTKDVLYLLSHNSKTVLLSFLVAAFGLQIRLVTPYQGRALPAEPLAERSERHEPLGEYSSKRTLIIIADEAI